MIIAATGDPRTTGLTIGTIIAATGDPRPGPTTVMTVATTVRAPIGTTTATGVTTTGGSALVRMN
jgi:hypothetical protein